MHLAFDICQGIGVAAAVGIRPFLPALAVRALAAGGVEIGFARTSYSFLMSTAVLLVLIVGVIAVTVAERQGYGIGGRTSGRGAGGRAAGGGSRDGGGGSRAAGGSRVGGPGSARAGFGASAGGLPRDPLTIALVLAGAVIAAVFFAGELARGHAVVWPGFIAGPACALVAAGASQPLFARVRARLDAGTAAAVPLYAEGIALVLAALSIVAPPVGPIGFVLLAWLLVASRRRGQRKYAGLRILR